MPAVKGIPALNLARFVAAIGVVCFHYLRHSIEPGTLQNVFGSGYAGVSFFFILSGFVLVLATRDLGAPRAIHDFFVRRIARIYPVYCLAWVLFGTCLLLTQLRSGPLSYYFLTRNAFFGLTSLLLVQQWLPGVAQHWNWPSWSLSVEAFFYATFPLLFAATRRWRVRTLVAVLALMLVLVAVQTAIAQGGNHPLLAGTVLATSWEDFALGLPISQLPLFVSGIVLARLYQQGVVVRIPGGWIVACLLVLSALMCGPRTMVAGLPRDAWLPPVFVLLIAALATTRLADKGLVARSCMLLGWASYSLYILQSPLWRLYWLAQGKDPGVVYSVKQVLPFVALLIGVSVAVYWLFERPTEKWIKGHFGGGPRRKPEAPRFQLPFPFPKRSTLPRG